MGQVRCKKAPQVMPACRTAREVCPNDCNITKGGGGPSGTPKSPPGFFLFFHGSVGFNEVKVKVLKRVFALLVDIDVYIMCSFCISLSLL